MKNKIYLLASLLTVLFFAACDDVYDHVAEPPQSYEQEDEQTINGFTFALGSDVSNAIVFTDDDLVAATPLKVIETKATPSIAEGATVKFIIESSNTDDFAKKVELASTTSENTASVTATELNAAVKSLYGKAPNARDIYLRAAYYIVDGKSGEVEEIE